MSPDEALDLGSSIGSSQVTTSSRKPLAEGARLAGRSKEAVAATKRAIYFGGSLPLRDGMRLERAEFLATVGSDDAKAAMRAYVDEFERTGELPAYDRGHMQETDRSGPFRLSHRGNPPNDCN